MLGAEAVQLMQARHEGPAGMDLLPRDQIPVVEAVGRHRDSVRLLQPQLVSGLIDGVIEDQLCQLSAELVDGALTVACAARKVRRGWSCGVSVLVDEAVPGSRALGTS